MVALDQQQLITNEKVAEDEIKYTSFFGGKNGKISFLEKQQRKEGKKDREKNKNFK